MTLMLHFLQEKSSQTLVCEEDQVLRLWQSQIWSISDQPGFVGRRVDCLGRGIDVKDNENVLTTLRRYLLEGKTKTAKLLRGKAVILLDPKCGKVVWPITNPG